ncbi:hypothetical protein ALNOE001_06830 [Candidatus Methanobinarius endosymbioticus]|uniref:Uncharacterized protein n=1 Tax=Candidatus Methanobinarius endosymbioticus TaxID=2006182 RepID=A0A366MDY1_9EURY|nr:hypothetical protein ALNOE001_06830 [Candidatus Methanobinarius endosymbioticus]
MKRLFITDCEGPISLNDNAYEISKEFIPNGDEFFRIISLFDDYLVDVAKKEDYNPGNTLKLIIPFFKAYEITNEDIINFSKEHIFLVDNAKKTLNLARKFMDSFILSTSYGQYIEAISDYLNFPIENTYFTQLDMNDDYKILDSEKEKLIEFKEIIVEIAKKESKDGNLNVDTLNKIFFEEIPKMDVYKISKDLVCIGGPDKQKAVIDILNKFYTFNEDETSVMYVGDSHTDVEPLKYAKNNGGLAVAFNGNEVAIKEANIAIVSDNTIATSLLIDLHSKFNKEYILKFARSYPKDTKRSFESFRIGFALIDEFNEIYNNEKSENKKDIPIIELVNEDNIDKLVSESMKMRKKIRGSGIGSLG